VLSISQFDPTRTSVGNLASHAVPLSLGKFWRLIDGLLLGSRSLSLGLAGRRSETCHTGIAALPIVPLDALACVGIGDAGELSPGYGGAERVQGADGCVRIS
jgi:hypothetical protein